MACTNSDAREEPDGLWLGEVVLVGVADGLGAVGGADFGVDVVDVGFDGCFADEELLGDFGVGVSGGELGEDFGFAGGEPGWWC